MGPLVAFPIGPLGEHDSRRRRRRRRHRASCLLRAGDRRDAHVLEAADRQLSIWPELFWRSLPDQEIRQRGLDSCRLNWPRRADR